MREIRSRGTAVAIGILLMLEFGMGAAFSPRAATKEKPERRFTLWIGDSKQIIATRAATLADALDGAGINIGPDDKVFPAPNAPVQGGMKARLMRIDSKLVTVEEAIARNTVRKSSPILRPGHFKLAANGKDGLSQVTYKLRFADGKRVGKERISAKVVREAAPRVVLYGRGSDIPSRGFSSRRVMVMHASAYDPGPGSCGPYANGRTSTGIKATKGVVAVDPRVIPLGTKLYIEGYGHALAADVGGAIKGNRIDLCYDTRAQALKFGRRKVVVHILE